MFAQLRWFGAVAVLAGASLLGTPDLSFAQRGGHGGGGGGGGGHGGGFGGGHGGGFGGGYGGGFYGGRGFGYGGYGYGGFGLGGYGYGLYGGYLGGYYPGGGYYYGGYPSYYSYPYDYYYSNAPVYGPGYSQGYSAVTPSARYAYAPGASAAPASQSNDRASVTAVVPENAKLWFNDVMLSTSGSTREFQTPPLAPGHSYTYQVRASWMQDGHEVSQTQTVAVVPGAPARIVFPLTGSPVGTNTVIRQ
jgi:uncharacterized protein (TIGR03000 family)